MKLARGLGILVLIVIAGLAYATWSARRWPGDQGARDRIVERAKAQSGVLDLTSVTPFHWTRLEIFGPYTSQDAAEQRLGFEWPYQWSRIEVLDDRDFLVFIDSNRVAAAFELSYRDAVIRAPDGWVSRETARLIIDHGALVSIEPPFESDLWPGEGIPVIQAERDTLVLFAEPRTRIQPVARRATRRGEQIHFDSTRYVTLIPVPFVEQPDSLRGRGYGRTRRVRYEQYYNGRHNTTIATLGARPVLLQYRAEGECFVSVVRQVMVTDCPDVADPPSTAWWAWTPGPDGAGWFVVSDSTAKVTKRRF